MASAAAQTYCDEAVAAERWVQLGAEAGGSEIPSLVLAIALIAVPGLDHAILAKGSDHTRIRDVHGPAAALGKAAVIVDIDTNATVDLTVVVYER
jgi:hypothetical protein